MCEHTHRFFLSHFFFLTLGIEHMTSLKLGKHFTPKLHSQMKILGRTIKFLSLKANKHLHMENLGEPLFNLP